MVTGHTAVMSMVVMRMIWQMLDHPDEEGGSKLCEIGGNEQREGQLIFLNSI